MGGRKEDVCLVCNGIMKRSRITILFLLVILLEFIGTFKNSYGQIITEELNKNNFIESFISNFEIVWQDKLFGRTGWINLFGLMECALGKRVVKDTEERYTVYKMDNGQLTFAYPYKDMTSFIDNYKKMALYLKNEEIPLLYVQAPFKVNKYDNKLPYDWEDSTNKMADDFIKGIRSVSEVIDLRDLLNDKQMDYSSSFFQTDHHWKPETGFWASCEIAHYLEDYYNFPLEEKYFSEDKFTFMLRKSCYLGSQGKRVGKYYAGLDDFTVISPQFYTEYVFSVPSLSIDRSGNFYDAFIFEEYLNDTDIYGTDMDCAYTGNNYSLSIAYNKQNNSGKKILLVRDSFSRVVAPFLAGICEELHIIDLRTFEGSVSEYAKEQDADIVIVLYNPSAVENSKLYEFEK